MTLGKMSSLAETLKILLASAAERVDAGSCCQGDCRLERSAQRDEEHHRLCKIEGCKSTACPFERHLIRAADRA